MDNAVNPLQYYVVVNITRIFPVTIFYVTYHAYRNRNIIVLNINIMV